MPTSAFTRAVQEARQEITETDPAPQPIQTQPTSSLKRGWATPPELKSDLVDEMIRIVQDPDVKTKDRVAAFNALRVADQSQWERDHPVESGKSKGGITNTTNNNVIIAAAAAVREAIERGQLGIIESLPAPDQSSASGNS